MVRRMAGFDGYERSGTRCTNLVVRDQLAFDFGADPAGINRFMSGLLIWLVISAVVTSWQGHLGGLLTGGLVALAFAYAPRDRRRVLVQAGACVGVLALLVVLALAKAAAMTG